MIQYIDALKNVLHNGEEVLDRTGVGTKSIFGYQMRFNLQKGFPAVTTKRLAWKSVVSELLWFLTGSTDERELARILYGQKEYSDKKTIWTANANKQGKDLGYINDSYNKFLGPIYGKQWRDFGGVDQVQQLIRNIKTNPYSRRHIISAWNTPEIASMALPPCHILVQFVVRDGKLSCHFYQRSADMFLGVPFNIASYALLTHIIAKLTKLEVGTLVQSIGDAHIYNNHLEQVSTQINRKPKELPKLLIEDNINDLVTITDNPCISSYKLINYKPMGNIKAVMAV